MKVQHIFKFSVFGISTILFKRKAPILGTIIVTDQCNLSCKHCSVNNITAKIYPYHQIKAEMKLLYKKGIRILFFCGGETFLWKDGDKTIRDLVKEAKKMGFLIVNVVTNGTFKLDLPEADLILLSLDGDKKAHNMIRGDTYDAIINNIDHATADNICLYMAINQINKSTIESVGKVAKQHKNVRAVSFNFHTPYPETKHLALTVMEKEKCCQTIKQMMKRGYPIFNLKSAFRYITNNSFRVPCHQCVVIENGKISTCGRCIEVPGLCEKCGYFFAAEYSLIFSGKLRVIFEMLTTYLRYL